MKAIAADNLCAIFWYFFAHYIFFKGMLSIRVDSDDPDGDQVYFFKKNMLPPKVCKKYRQWFHFSSPSSPPTRSTSAPPRPSGSTSPPPAASGTRR